MPDPFANANAVWYVRHPTGGQYGPAKPDVMRRWLGEGRVSADSLVWCEGWPQWKRADETFPQFSAGRPPTFAGNVPMAIPTGAIPTGAMAAVAAPMLGMAHVPMAGPAPSPTAGVDLGHRFAYRRRSEAGRMIIIAILTLAVLLLVPVLIWVLMSQGTISR